jgi:hypothetical protein
MVCTSLRAVKNKIGSLFDLRHHDVEQDERRLRHRQQPADLLRIAHRHDRVAARAQGVGEQPQHAGIVFDQQDRASFARGHRCLASVERMKITTIVGGDS